MRYHYKNVNVRNLKGLKLAEKLQSQGWKIINAGIDTLLFEKLY